MKKRAMLSLLAGWLAVSCAGEGLLWAADPQPSGSGVIQLAPLGLTSIFAARSKTAGTILVEGGRFQASGKKISGASVSAFSSLRPLLRDHFYHNLKLGVAILDQTLVEFAQRRGQRLQLSYEERDELAAVLDRAVRPLLIRYHTAETGQGIFGSALSLATARARVYDQIFVYLSEGIADPAIREFMRTSFEPREHAGPFVPQAGVRADFLALWAKYFAQQPLDPSFPLYLPPATWQGLLVAYHREILHFQARVGPQHRGSLKQGLETFLSLMVGWAPLNQAVDFDDRAALRKIAAMPFHGGEAHQHFVRDLLAIAAAENHGRGQERGRNFAAQAVLQGMRGALATLRQQSDFLQATPPIGSALPSASVVASASLQQLFALGSPVANLWAHFDTTTLAGLLGEQTLRRLEHSTAALEATLAALGVEPHLSQDRIHRLTELLCTGYQQYPAAAQTEQGMLSHLRRIEEAYWKEVEQSYPEAARQGKVTAGFLPTAAAMQDFLREFSKQTKEKIMPALSLAETTLLQQALPLLQTKEGVAEVVHLLLARGAGYPSAPLPALEQVQREMQEYELHPSWVSKRSLAVANVIRELAGIYRMHPGAPQLAPVKLLLQPLLAVGFGLPSPPASPVDPAAGGEAIDARPSGEGGAGQEAASSSRQEAEGRTSAEREASAVRHLEGPR